jgi:hypothetical protein
LLCYLRALLPKDHPLRQNPMMMLPVYVGRLKAMPALKAKNTYGDTLDKGQKAAILAFLGKHVQSSAKNADKESAADSSIEADQLEDSSDVIAPPHIEMLENHMLESGDDL